MNKKLFISLLLCCFVIMPIVLSASAQVMEKEKEPATKLEAFLATKGKLIIKEFYELGKVNGKYGSKIEFTALVIYEPGEENKRVRGLRIQVTEAGRYKKEDTSFLDPEEIESLSKALDYMVDLSGKWNDIKKKYVEVVFSTKGDFNIGFYQEEAKQVAFLIEWPHWKSNMLSYFDARFEFSEVFS